MAELLLIAVAAATIDNFVLARLLGLCPVFSAGSGAGTSGNGPIHALKLGLATAIVMAISGGLGQQLNYWILVPWKLPYLRILGLLAVTGLTVQAVNSILGRLAARGSRTVQLPVVTIHCAVLGVALLTTGTSTSSGPGATDTLPGAIALGIGAGLGFTLVLCVFASLRARLEQAAIPAPLRGPAIALLTVGMMALAFLGFSGLSLSGSGS
ncbi:MAG: Rnf-Nqr domain containing protein [Gammaproteobacteria bacterium]